MPYNPQFGKAVTVSTDDPDPFEFGRMVYETVYYDEYGRETVEREPDDNAKLEYYGENHIIIIGKQGSGKDTRLLIPNLLRMRGRSFVCVDPKGEMAAVTAPVRARYGSVFILNPFGVLCDYQGYGYMEGCGFNPLCALDPRSPDLNMDAGLIAEAFVKVTSDEKQPFFPITARALVAFLIMVEVVKAAEQGRDPLLFNVRRMLCEPNGGAETRIVGRVTMTIPATGIPLYAQQMTNCAIMGLRNKAGMFTRWGKEMESVVATARSETEFLDDPQIAYCLSRNGFRFEEIKQRPTTVYLVLPPKVIERHSKWLRLCLTSALNAALRPRAAGEPRTLFILNEFAAIGHLSLVETNYAVVRGAGIQMALILQDLNQLQQLYKDRWQTFTGNAGVTATFAPSDLETAEWFSKRCAETDRPKVSVSQSYNWNSGNTVNQGLAGNGETSGTGVSGGSSGGWSAQYDTEHVPLVTPYDLFSMKPGEMRILWEGMGDSYNGHAKPYYRRDDLIAETRPPKNPYEPNVRIPRVHWQQPDYEGFMLGLLNASLPAGIDGGTWGNDSSGDGGDLGGIFGAMFGGSKAPTSNAPADNGDGLKNFWKWQDAAPPAPPAPPEKPPQSPAQENIRPDVQARHPAFVREPPKQLRNPAARHPGYTPDPPKPDDKGGDDWGYADDDSTF